MTPRTARWLVVAGASAAVLVAAAAHGGGGSSADATPLRVKYAYADDAAEIVEPLVARFNAEHHALAGRDITIVGTAQTLTSGQAEAALAQGSIRPALWTPASSLWSRLLAHDADPSWLPRSSPSLVYSPQVIAIWQELARVLGRPGKQIGWSDVLKLATSPRGWAAVGHPEFGPFRLGHTNPDYSTSGLSAVVSEYYAVTHKRSGLTLADVLRASVRERVRAIEHSIVHYGTTASAFTSQMEEYGRPYASAVYIQDWQVDAFNAGRRKAPRLVGVVPAEGTFVANYPLIALRAPWVDGETFAAARVAVGWLRAHVTREMAAKSHRQLRPPPRAKVLELPPADVLAAIRDGWRRDRKPANIVLVVDTSASMDRRGRLAAAKSGLLSFLGELSPFDRVGLVTSGAAVETAVPLGLSAQARPAVVRAVRSLFPNGAQPVYPAIERALRTVRALRDQERINAVVVLSDGSGTSKGFRSLLAAIRAESQTEGTSVRIFTVAYGGQADSTALRRIATASAGAFDSGGPSDIKDVYRGIASYF